MNEVQRPRTGRAPGTCKDARRRPCHAVTDDPTPPRHSRMGFPACATIARTTDMPRGALLPGNIVLSMSKTDARSATSASTAADEIAGTLLAPEIATRFRSLA